METSSILTILGMGAATYLTRFSGYFIAGRLNMPPRFRYALQSIPIAILVAIAAPIILKGTAAEILSAIIVAAAAATGRGLLVCMAVGIIAVNIFRYFF